MKGERFSSVGTPIASILLRNLEFVVERQPHVFDRTLKEADIDQHAGHGIWHGAQSHLGPEGVAVDLFARRAKGRSRQRVVGLEAE
jgi:hypothetical protein